MSSQTNLAYDEEEAATTQIAKLSKKLSRDLFESLSLEEKIRYLQERIDHDLYDIVDAKTAEEAMIHRRFPP